MIQKLATAPDGRQAEGWARYSAGPRAGIDESPGVLHGAWRVLLSQVYSPERETGIGRVPTFASRTAW